MIKALHFILYCSVQIYIFIHNLLPLLTYQTKKEELIYGQNQLFAHRGKRSQSGQKSVKSGKISNKFHEFAPDTDGSLYWKGSGCGATSWFSVFSLGFPAKDGGGGGPSAGGESAAAAAAGSWTFVPGLAAWQSFPLRNCRFEFSTNHRWQYEVRSISTNIIYIITTVLLFANALRAICYSRLSGDL